MARINALQHKTRLKVKAWNMIKFGQVE